MADPNDTHALIKELAGDKCRCGKAKKPQRTFCRQCYFILPQAMRTRLYDRVGEGYELAYRNAVEHLDQQTTEQS